MSKRAYKSEILYEQLLSDLLSPNWEAGQRFYSENQLCNKYHVSRQTVRNALQYLREQNLLVTRQGSGTFVGTEAIRRRNISTRTIGVLVTYLSDYIFPHIIKELERVFASSGYRVQLASTHNSISEERKLLQSMLDQSVDGIILEPTKSALPNPNFDVYENLEKERIPLICINAGYPGLSFPVVRLDDEEAGYMAASYLVERSHTRIGGIFKSDDMQGHLRYLGFQKALLEHRVSFVDSDIYWYTTEDIGEFDTYYDCILKRLQECTGIVTYNDQIAFHVLKLAEQHGIHVPEQLSIASIDDSRLASIARPALTSVHNPVSDIGRIAATNLLKLINGSTIDANHQFKPRLTIRQSVAKPRAASLELLQVTPSGYLDNIS